MVTRAKGSLWFLACLSWVFVFTSSTVSAQELGGEGTKFNLDLPFDAIGETGEDEEDPPEVVQFYGQNLEGDGFFYVVDRSGSMQDSGELQRAKQEITRNLTEVSNKTEFAVVFFDLAIKKFPTSGRPVEASAGMKSAGISFINGVPGGRGSCMALGLREGLQFANLSSAKRKVMVYVGDGGGTCNGANESNYLQQMVAQITAANYQRVQINCIGVLMAGRALQERYMKQLCASNGGTYRQIN
jgi:Mg-chelatase subunit ChlD